MHSPAQFTSQACTLLTSDTDFCCFQLQFVARIIVAGEGVKDGVQLAQSFTR